MSLLLRPSGPGHVHSGPDALTGTTSSSRLLLIEPDEAVAAALSRGLRRHGWTVSVVHTAETGLRLQMEWTPHIVLLALDLPDMTVYGLVTRLAEHNGCGILVLTGSDEDDLGRATLAWGAHDIVGKPIRAMDLAARILALQRRLGQLAPMPDLMR